jgi:hypothetical protein
MSEVQSREIDAFTYGIITYQFNDQHRNMNPNKSRWTVSINDEATIFQHAASWLWLVKCSGCGWGLHTDAHGLHYLGTVPGEKHSFIAKFVSDNNHNAWHGYPADHMSNPHDIPPANILTSWVKNKFIGNPKMRKIMKGQPCSI